MHYRASWSFHSVAFEPYSVSCQPCSTRRYTSFPCLSALGLARAISLLSESFLGTSTKPVSLLNYRGLALFLIALGKHAPAEFEEVTRDVESLHPVIQAATLETQNPNSILLWTKDGRQRELVKIVGNCRTALEDLQKLIADCKPTGSAFRRVVSSYKLNSKRVQRVRDQLVLNTTAINLFLTTHCSSGLGVLGKELKDVISDVKNGKKEPSILAAASDDHVTDAHWTKLRNELLDRGLTTHDLDAYKSHVLAYLHKLVEIGELQRTQPLDANASSYNTQDKQSSSQQNLRDLQNKIRRYEATSGKEPIRGPSGTSLNRFDRDRPTRSHDQKAQTPSHVASPESYLSRDSPFEEHREQITEYDERGLIRRRTFRSTTSPAGSYHSRNSSVHSTSRDASSVGVASLDHSGTEHDSISPLRRPTGVTRVVDGQRIDIEALRARIADLEAQLGGVRHERDVLAQQRERFKAWAENFASGASDNYSPRRSISKLRYNYTTVLRSVAGHYRDERDQLRRSIEEALDDSPELLSFIDGRPPSPTVNFCMELGCPLVFQSAEELSTHLETGHELLVLTDVNRNGPFRCQHVTRSIEGLLEWCRAVRDSPFALIAHETYTHGGSPRLVRCELGCSRNDFHDSYSLARHMCENHPGIVWAIQEFGEL